MYEKDHFKDIKTVYSHPMFDDPEIQYSIYDIAILELESSMETYAWIHPNTHVTVRPACLPRLTDSQKTYPGDLMVCHMLIPYAYTILLYHTLISFLRRVF